VNVNCFTTTSDTYYTKYNRLAPQLWNKVFAKDRKQQETITTVKRNVNDNLQVSNSDLENSHLIKPTGMAYRPYLS